MSSAAIGPENNWCSKTNASLPRLSALLSSGSSRALRLRRHACLMNGKQRTDEITIELAWRYLRSNMDAGLDVSSAAIIARCPGVALERVRAGVRRRLMESVGS